jgi:ferredoxin
MTKLMNEINTLKFFADKCTGCGLCVTVCPHAVWELANGKARIVRREACMECGACRLNCDEGAIEVDSGVGCAAAMIIAALTGKEEPTCG